MRSWPCRTTGREMITFGNRNFIIWSSRNDAYARQQRGRPHFTRICIFRHAISTRAKYASIIELSRLIRCWDGYKISFLWKSKLTVRALRWICGKAGRRRSGTRGDYGHMMVDFRPYRSPLCLGIIQKMPRHLQLIAPCSQLWPLQNARRFYEVIPLALLRFLHKISRFTTLSAW